MLIREVRPEEHERLGRITLEAYTRLDGHVPEPEYEASLADIASRSREALVLAAVDDDGRVLGGVTYVGDPSSPWAEHGVDGAASIRMLAVDPAVQGRGIGEALTRACLDLARREGRPEVILHSTAWMAAAHRLYQRLGFVRDPTHDWEPVAGIHLMCFRLRLEEQ